ncbi:hypothetical protein GWC77_25290 [Paraburkholderia sp. NMBU_R16]|uniref:hypothetical protein n=1 Tax=Paraburkholderia sp. NMBU_R16 TaxID=2698676 RepID=UPI00156796F3|nr:hypothetical protein [Paraburkholderia sp. NMBU_R16]NRO99213.1 hypothetical protein [Paraburkholderia sp. NMBU_R16]
MTYTDDEARTLLEAHSRAGQRQPQPNPLTSLMEAAERALGYRDYGSADNPRREPFPAASRVMIDLSQFVADGNPSPNVYGVQNRPAGETLTLDPRAVIEQHSVVAQAGTRIIIAHPRDRAIAIGGGEKTDGLLGFYEDPQLVRNVEPAQFATLADASDATVSSLPFRDQLFTWPSVPTAAFRVTVTRDQNRQVGGGDDLRDALLRSVLMGLGLYADKLLLTAIAAATPAAFTFGAAAAKFLKVDDLRAVIGTTGTGAGYRGDGAFVANPGIPGEISEATAGTYIGAFSSAAVAVWPELTVQARRLSTAGDLEVTCLVNAQAVLPDAGKFWTVAA